jgi:hypothetical protein
LSAVLRASKTGRGAFARSGGDRRAAADKWRADDEMSLGEEHQRQVLNASVRTILLSTITDHILTTEFEVLDDGTRRLSEVRLRMYTQLVTRSHEKSATDTDYFCESFRYDRSVDNGGLAQMERLLQFGRVLSRSI